MEGIPTIYVIDKNGKIVYGHQGFDMSMEYQLASELRIKQKGPAEGASDGDASH